jgi:hypothetical protein
MTGVADIAVPALALLGGGAVGAALGGLALWRTDWTGGRLRGAIAACAACGAVFGLVATVGLPMPALASLLPKSGEAADKEALEGLLKTDYPDEYAQALSTRRTLAATGASQAQVDQAIERQMKALMQRQLPLANDANTLAMLAISEDELTAIHGNPALCYRLAMQPSPGAADEAIAALPDDLRVRERQLALQVLQQTATAPQPPKPPADLDDKLRIWAIDSVNGLAPDEKQALGSGGELQGKAACDAVGNLIHMLVMMNGREAVEAYKALSVRGMQRSGG